MSYDDDIEDVDEGMDEITHAAESDDEKVESPSQTNEFIAKVDESRIAQVLSGAPDHPAIKAILDRLVRAQQLYGDKDGGLAGLFDDAIAEIYLLILEIKNKPDMLIMSSLDLHKPEIQVQQIDQLMQLLETRKNNIHDSTTGGGSYLRA